MRAPILIVFGIGIIACGGAAEESTQREREPDALPTPASPPAPVSETPKKAPPPARLETGVDSNAIPTPTKNITCQETILEASCATSHEHLAKALDLCFETKGDLSAFLAEERCTTQAGFKKARATCCYGGVVSTKPPALPVVAPTTTVSGMGASSAGHPCPGVELRGSEYAVIRAEMCAKSGLELVSFGVHGRCADGTVQGVGESCATLVAATQP